MNPENIEKEIVSKGLSAPRNITPDEIESYIAGEQYYNFPGTTFTVCCITLKNGYVVTGESAAHSPENFDHGTGRKIARVKAIEKIWPLADFFRREKIYQENS